MVCLLLLLHLEKSSNVLSTDGVAIVRLGFILVSCKVVVVSWNVKDVIDVSSETEVHALMTIAETIVKAVLSHDRVLFNKAA